jgi:chromosomal replication initiation ATPase DnaA
MDGSVGEDGFMDVWERLRRDRTAARLAADVASYALGVPIEQIFDFRRGTKEAAFARQVAVYLCHIGYEWSLARVAAAFGRDRSTVAYACHAIEDRREEAHFDLWIAGLEAMVRVAPRREVRVLPEVKSL